MKTEPSTFGIDDLEHAPDQTTSWEGVRNYQARNMLRDDMAVGDLALLYHSSCPEPGIAGVDGGGAHGLSGCLPHGSGAARTTMRKALKTSHFGTQWMCDSRQRARAVLPLATLREHAARELDGLLAAASWQPPVDHSGGCRALQVHSLADAMIELDAIDARCQMITSDDLSIRPSAIGCLHATSLSRLLVFLQRVYILGPRTNL